MAAFFWTQFAGAFNDNFYKNALILWISFGAPGLEPGLRNTLIILCSGIFILPFFLFSATAGWLADSQSKDRVIRWTKLAEILIMGAGAMAFLAGSIPALIIVLFFMGAQSAWFGPAKYGVIPELVPEENLLRANGLVAMGTFVAILTGTLFGGLAGSLNDGRILAACSVVLIAVFGWLASLKIPRLGAKAPGTPRAGGWIRETGIRLGEIRRETRIFPLLVAISWFWFHGAFILQLLPIHIMHAGENTILPAALDWMHGSAGMAGSQVTLSLLLFSGGIGIGSMIPGRRKTRHIETASSVWALGLLSLTAMLVPLVEDIFPVVFCILALSGIAAGLYSVPLYAAIQATARPAIRARIFSGGNILDAGFMVGASLLMQVLEMTRIAPVQRFLVLGLLDLAFLAVWIRKRSDLVERVRLRFLQDTRRELLGHPVGPAVFLYSGTVTKSGMASLALSFSCLPAGYRGETVPQDEWNRLLASDVSIIQPEGVTVPAGIPVFIIRLEPSGFVCHPAEPGVTAPANKV